jgi:hypothetical protein
MNGAPRVTAGMYSQPPGYASARCAGQEEQRPPTAVDEPLIEAVMLGQAGNAGISFTSAGRVVKSDAGTR